MVSSGSQQPCFFFLFAGVGGVGSFKKTTISMPSGPAGELNRVSKFVLLEEAYGDFVDKHDQISGFHAYPVVQ